MATAYRMMCRKFVGGLNQVQGSVSLTMPPKLHDSWSLTMKGLSPPGMD